MSRFHAGHFLYPPTTVTADTNEDDDVATSGELKVGAAIICVAFKVTLIEM